MPKKRELAPRFVLDFETRSSCDLKQCGAWVYSEHPSTEIIVGVWRVDNQRHVWLPLNREPSREQDWMKGRVCYFGPEVPRPLLEIAKQRVAVAHNAEMEQAIMTNICGHPLPRVEDTTAALAYYQLPINLDSAGRALGLGGKDAGGKHLINRFSRGEGGHVNEFLPFMIGPWVEYCVQDVDLTWEIDQRISPWFPEDELAVWQAHFEINCRGIAIDRVLLDKIDAAGVLIEKEEVSLPDGVRQKDLTRVDYLRGWLKRRGFAVPDMRKERLEKLLENPRLPNDVRTVVEARLGSNRVSLKKTAAIRRQTSSDGYLRGQFRYYGPNTGRWAGWGVQVQNLPKPPSGDLIKLQPQCVEAVRTLPPSEIESAVGHKLPDVLVTCVRGILTASPGHRLISVDYAQIEARGVLWLAEDDEHLEWWRTRDMYSEMASRLFGREIRKGVDKIERDVGKRVILSCNFQIGADRFGQDCIKNYRLDLSSLGLTPKGVIDTFRSEFKSLSDPNHGLWARLQRAMVDLAEGPGPDIRVGKHLVFKRRNGTIFIELPSGRELVYRQPRVSVEKRFRHDGSTWDHKTVTYYDCTGSWEKLYGGKIADHVTQGSMRDLLADTLVKVHAGACGRDVRVVMHTHDEVVVEAPTERAEKVKEQLEDLMIKGPPWAAGLPIAVEGTIGERYAK